MSGRPVVSDQIRLVIGLRWRLFRNSLRTLRGRLDSASLILIWLLTTGMMIAGGVGFGFGAYVLLERQQPGRLADMFWGIFLFWQLYPIFSGAGGAQFDFSRLLRFPLRYRGFFFLSVVYGMADPVAVTSLFWLICLAIGVGTARPGLLPWALLVGLLFAAMNLLLARAIATWADRWMAQRRTREIVGMLLILGVLALQFLLPALPKSSLVNYLSAGWLRPLLEIASALPPGAAGLALAGSVAGSALQTFAGFLLLCLYPLALLWLLHVRLIAQYRGENLSETVAAALPAARATDVSVPAAIWRLPGLSGAIGALVEREARYTLRNWQVMVRLLIPAIFVLLLGPNLKHSAFVVRYGDMVFPVAVGYAFFSEMNWVFNSFGFDGTGIRFLLLAPVRFRRVMLGKNLFHAITTFANVLLIWVCVRWVFGPTELMVVMATLAAALYATLANYAVGNVVSIYFPKQLHFGVFRKSGVPAGAALVAGLATEIVLIVSGVIVFVVAKVLDRMGLAALIFLVLSAIAAVGYVVSLRKVDGAVLSRRESLTEELCRAQSSS
jgi:ABC-2 type transport system permease protein